MKCSNFIDPMCFDGSCPRALFYEFDGDYGELISCEECSANNADCNFCAGCCCPLEYILSEALPAYDYYHGYREW